MNEVSPVTQEEAQTFFQRIATMAVGYSAQANQINNLGHELKALGERLDAIRQEADKLRAEVAETWEFAHRMEAERDAAKAETARVRSESDQIVSGLQGDISSLRSELSQAHDAMVARDQRIAELEQALATSHANLVAAQESNVKLGEELAATRSNRDYWQGEANSGRDQVQSWQQRYRELNASHTNLAAMLDQVQAKLEEFRSLFNPQPAPATGTNG